MIDVDLNDAQIVRSVKDVRDRSGQVPIVVFTAESNRHWEEEAYLLGVAHVLEKPIRSRLLNHILGKLLGGTETSAIVQHSAQIATSQASAATLMPPQPQPLHNSTTSGVFHRY